MARVLLVDDSESNRLVLGSLLEEAGVDVEVAISFADAQAKVTGVGSPYDVILLDQHLGDGLGTNLVPAMRSAMPTAKIFLLSGSASEESIPASAGLDATLDKGIAFDDLLERVNRASADAK